MGRHPLARLRYFLMGRWALWLVLFAGYPVTATAQYSCNMSDGCYFACSPPVSGRPNGAIHMCSCSGAPIIGPPNGSHMGSACYDLGSQCAPWESYPMSTVNCQQSWSCQPGQACTTSSGCSGTCVYSDPSENYSGAPVGCVPAAGSQVCGSACCDPESICSAGECKPRCGNSPYSPATQCCVNETVLPKFQIADLASCPDRGPRPGYSPSVNGCGPEGWGWAIPDKYGLANFGPSCDSHDTCYGTCNSSKAGCDSSLKSLLAAECGRVYPQPQSLRRADCLGMVDRFYNAVNEEGAGAYDKAQKKGCICCQ